MLNYRARLFAKKEQKKKSAEYRASIMASLDRSQIFIHFVKY